MDINTLNRYHHYAFLSIGALFILTNLMGLTPPLTAQIIILSLVVAVVGIPHGALDPLVAYQAGVWKKPAGLLLFMLAYAGLSVSVVAAWLYLPTTSLMIFLMVSAWHFAGDWKAHLPLAVRVLASSSVIVLPTLWYAPEIQQLFAWLTSAEAAAQLTQGLSVIAPVHLGLLALALPYIWSRDSAAAAEIAILSVAAVLLPPLVLFFLYFCALHSPRHLIKHIANAAVSPSTVIATLLIFSLLTFILAAIYWYFVVDRHAVITQQLTQIIFIGLAALTMPHMVLITKTKQQF
ncbi:MAG: Brp/Blh family beta-carotene 15,15'-dioxygenase [Candidatus Thiothrix sulfatifontis]|nr:MAG: Brp/Blh family beta-carotene 15,15'-dioxygenase [Candidatus Thiothrix sulfatifontis]